LLELRLVESNEVVLNNVIYRCKQVSFEQLFPVLVLDDERSLEVEVILLTQNFLEGRILATIDADLVKLVPEMILEGFFFGGLFFRDDVVLASERDAVQHIVLFVQ